jgi:hypothetical protein
MGPAHIEEGVVVHSGKYLLTRNQLIYVVTSEGTAYKSGSAFLYHRTDIGSDELKPEIIELAGGIRSFRNSPSRHGSLGRVQVTLGDGASITLVFVPDGVYADRLRVAADATQRILCQTAQALGAEDLGAD